jgi:hypothetical protein
VGNDVGISVGAGVGALKRGARIKADDKNKGVYGFRNHQPCVTNEQWRRELATRKREG